MNSSLKFPLMHPERVAEPLAGTYVASVPLPEKADLSDWVELMEVVEALCPLWPEKDKVQGRGNWRL